MGVRVGEILYRVYLDKFQSGHPTLSILDLPTEKEFLRGSFPGISSENELYVFAASDYTDVNLGASFDVLVPLNSPNETISVKSILKYISINPSYESNYIPKGYSAICLLEFPDGKPDELKKLAMYGEKKNDKVHDTLILTQSSILKILVNDYNVNI